MYSYETFPGQTIVRTTDDGYTFSDLCETLAVNCDGVITTDDERCDPSIRAIELLALRDCRVQITTHKDGKCSVQIFDNNGLIADVNVSDNPPINPKLPIMKGRER